MKKLNNKGFAITAILYSILILFLLLFLATLKILNTRNDRIEKNYESVMKNFTSSDEVNINVDLATGYSTKYRGRYEIKINESTVYTYLPAYTLIVIKEEKLTSVSSGGVEKTLMLLNKDNEEIKNENITSAILIRGTKV